MPTELIWSLFAIFVVAPISVLAGYFIWRRVRDEQGIPFISAEPIQGIRDSRWQLFEIKAYSTTKPYVIRELNSRGLFKCGFSPYTLEGKPPSNDTSSTRKLTLDIPVPIRGELSPAEVDGMQQSIGQRCYQDYINDIAADEKNPAPILIKVWVRRSRLSRRPSFSVTYIQNDVVKTITIADSFSYESGAI